MGIAAVSSHAVSKKHLTAVSIVQSASQTNIRAFFGAGPNLPCSMTATTTSECVSTVPSTSAESVPAKPVAVAPDGKASLNGFLVKKCVTKAEVVWCLNTIATHESFRSAAASAALFPIMFPTCDVAKKLQLGSILFPLKFCSVRWLENGKALARALQVLPNVVKYVEHVKKEKKLPACGSYAHVETAVKDEMLPVKLAFMLSVSEELEPFLAEFQTEKPMLPFLATALDGLLRSLLGRIVLKEKLDAAGTFSKLIKIYLENPNNIIGIAAFDIGLAAKSELRKITKPSHTAVVSVKKECILFVKVCSAKIIERSPLKYKLTRGASCLNPAVCAASVEAGQKQLNIALEVLIEHGRLTGLQGERASRSYVQVCSNSTAQVRLRKFDRARERLEKLWVELCASSHEELLLFVKIVLCLSHGNSSVERGFSVNKECLVENMKEESLVAQRLVYDEVSAAGGVAEVDVIDMVRSSNIKWKEDLERKKKERLDVLDAEREKKRTAALVKELESKKQKLMEDAQLQVSMLQQEIESLKQ
ncbi:hypothetical protein HPB51_004221 [Rhipicephalus microplus]|uniref:Uncharacterized protein n=1 Tax=Rhipicephalus microplus TaxID=6941 RepID=A0A9J6DYS2_RHIMP|nr:hypothetical protein HPB51_004221 [Rhipicephalus microplus]